MPDFSVKQRQKLAAKGQAMPQGGFPIRNRADLKRAIQAIGRAKNPEATKAWIKKRAKELNATDLIPESWSVTHYQKPSLDELSHHGVKGMKWGDRKAILGGKPQEINKPVGRRFVREFETVATLAGVAALGVAFAHSPRAQTAMKIPAKAAVHYMSDKNNRRRVGRFIKNVGIVYSKL